MDELWRRRPGDVSAAEAGRQLRALMTKYDGICQYCFKKIPAGLQTRDHIKRLIDGGTSDMDNLTLACSKCNSEQNAVAHYAALIPKLIQDCIQRQAKGLPPVGPATANSWTVADVWPVVIRKGISGTIRRQAKGVILVGRAPRSVPHSGVRSRKEANFC